MAPSSTTLSKALIARPPLWPGRAEFALTDRSLLTLSVRDGDLLRSESGAIWITRDGHLRDLVLAPGAGHRVQGDARLLVSGFGAARLTVIAGAPS